MIASGAIESGMIPKVQACLETLEHGVRKVHIIDGRLRHSLLLEVYTSKGVGTEIVQNGKCDVTDGRANTRDGGHAFRTPHSARYGST